MMPRSAIAWFAVSLVFAPPAGAEHARALTLLNWSEYLDPEVVARFEHRFDAQVQEIYYETDDLLDAMLLETDGAGYDLVMVTGIRMDSYRKRGWLAPIDGSRIPNLNLVDPRWRDAFPGTREFGVPYFWGTVGIAYRSDKVATAPRSWMDLFRPAPALIGRIGMIDSLRDSVGMALKALGHSVNASDPAAIDAALQLLADQRPAVKTYGYPTTLDEHSSLVTGELWIAMIYNGDALMIKGHQPLIEFVVPVEGGNLWVDYWVVMARSRHKELAWAFLDFINEPENAAQLARFVNYPSPNTRAAALLPADFLNDRTINPDADTLARSEFYVPLWPRAMKRAQTAFAKILK